MCKCWVVGSGSQWSGEGRGGEHGDSRDGSGGFLRRTFGVQILTDFFAMLWSSITNLFHVDNNFQQSLVVKKPSEEEEAAATRRKC